MIIFNKSVQHIHITSGQYKGFAAVFHMQQTFTPFAIFLWEH